MLKTHFFSQKLSFYYLQAFLNENIPLGRIYIKKFAFIGKNHFDVVKIDKRSRHGCDNSEHVLWSSKNLSC